MDALALSADPETSENTSSLNVSAVATAFSASDAYLRRIPLFAPRDQAYYWTVAWQRGEAEALREVAEGKTRRFSSGAAAAEWLLSDDES